jgi:hypothetical protein
MLPVLLPLLHISAMECGCMVSDQRHTKSPHGCMGALCGAFNNVVVAPGVSYPLSRTLQPQHPAPLHLHKEGTTTELVPGS